MACWRSCPRHCDFHGRVVLITSSRDILTQIASDQKPISRHRGVHLRDYFLNPVFWCFCFTFKCGQIQTSLSSWAKLKQIHAPMRSPRQPLSHSDVTQLNQTQLSAWQGSEKIGFAQSFWGWETQGYVEWFVLSFFLPHGPDFLSVGHYPLPVAH